jgi:hypothetical protein
VLDLAGGAPTRSSAPHMARRWAGRREFCCQGAMDEDGLAHADAGRQCGQTHAISAVIAPDRIIPPAFSCRRVQAS